MVECWLPYGKTEVYVSVPLRNLVGTVEPDRGQPSPDPKRAILESLQSPIESRALGDLAKTGAKAAVAIDGTMTPFLATSALSAVVETLLRSNIPADNISIVVGNGLRERSNQELTAAIQASEGLQGVGVLEHTRDASNFTLMGTTSRGTEVKISSPFADADVRIAIGEVMVDHFSGLRGAHSTVLPALSGKATIAKNRSISLEEEVAPGVIEGNAVYSDTVEAARMAKVDLALNLVTNGKGDLLKAFSGDIDKALEEAVKELGDLYRVKAEANADIIVVSAGGSRFDFDLYNSVWALNSVAPIAKKGATIVLLAECPEGLGADGLSALSQVDTLSELRRRFMLGARAVYLIKTTLRRNEVILVSALPGYIAEPLGFTVDRTANEALKRLEGRRSKRTLVVTNGCSTIPFVG